MCIRDSWLSDFKSVNTGAARYQSTSINQTKLSGQCGRLKCCLNYELDMYMEAVKDFPDDVDVLKTKLGNASLIKTCLLYTSPSPRDRTRSRMPSSALKKKLTTLS